jgi:hypothetical protein
MEKSYKGASMPDETNASAKHKQNTPKEWPGALNAYSDTLERLKKNNKPALLFLGVTLAASVFSLLLQPDVSPREREYVNYADLMYFVFLLAVPTYALAVADNKLISAKQAMRFSFMKFFSLIIAFILTGLIVGVSVLLFIIPAIWTIAWLYLAAYAVVDKDLGPINALKESKRLAAEHKGKVWGVIGVGLLVSIGAGVLGFIPLVGDVAAMAATLWAAASAALLYRWLQKQA